MTRHGMTDPASHLVKRCSRYDGSTEQAWEFAMSLSPAELPVMAYDNSNTPMRAFLDFLAKQPSSGQAALHSRK